MSLHGKFETCRPTVKCLLVGLDRKSSVRVRAMLLTPADIDQPPSRPAAMLYSMVSPGCGLRSPRSILLLEYLVT
jgi:hypothetical protein